MATVVPFSAIRPAADKVHLVASRSVDGYDPADLRKKLSGNPYTFLHVINPDFHDGVKTKPGSPERLSKIKERFRSFVSDKIFTRDTKPAYYLYRQVKHNNEYTGIIACTSIDDYFNGAIKIHEQTITQREEKLKEYLEVCEFNAEPVLFCYPNDEVLDNIVLQRAQRKPDYDFTTTDKIRHTLWVINDEKTVKLIERRFSSIPYIYIADGHHRSASSALLGKSRRQALPGYSGNEGFNYYMGIFFAETQLRIFDYNRVVKDLNGKSIPELLEVLEDKFYVQERNEELFKPTQKHELSLYTGKKWYSLKAKRGTYNSEDPVGSLDASILTKHILGPLFGIHDLKTDKRIGFVPGVKGPQALKNMVDEGKAELAFGLHPVTMDHLKWIADTDNIMPPKSTWVEPKIRSALVIYSFADTAKNVR